MRSGDSGAVRVPVVRIYTSLRGGGCERWGNQMVIPKMNTDGGPPRCQLGYSNMYLKSTYNGSRFNMLETLRLTSLLQGSHAERPTP